MLNLSYQTDMPAGDQIICYLSWNVSINKGELKKNNLLQKILISTFDILTWRQTSFMFL